MSGFAEGTPTVEIVLGGKNYTLGWTWGAKRRLKERVPDLTDANALAENLPAVLWASLDKDTREELSVEDVEELIHPANEVKVIEAIGTLFTQSEPDPEVKAPPAAVKTPTAGSSTSNKFGPLASTT